MTRLTPRPSINNLKLDIYHQPPTPSFLQFSKVFVSLYQSLGRYRAGFDPANSPSPMSTPPMSSLEQCGGSPDLTKITSSKNPALPALANVIIRKIKDNPDLARHSHASVPLTEEDLDELREYCMPKTPQFESFFQSDEKLEKKTDDNLTAAQTTLKDIHFCIADKIHDFMQKIPQGKLTTAYDLSCMKLEIMDSLVNTYTPLKKHKPLFELALIQMTSEFQKSGIRLRPGDTEEQTYLRDIQRTVVSQVYSPTKTQIAVIPRFSTDTFVVGAGPGGLWAALKALEEGRGVVLLEKRNSFDRISVVELNLYASSRILEIAGKIQLKNPDARINNKPISVIVASLEQSKQIKTKDLQALLLPELKKYEKFIFLPEVNIDSIDGNAQAAILVHPKGNAEQLCFNNIVHADGVDSASHQMLIQDTHLEGLITEGHFDEAKENADSQNYKFQGGMYMLQNGSQPFFNAAEKPNHHLQTKLSSNDATKHAIQNLKSLGWNEDRLPVVYMFSDSNRDAVWVAGERPEKVKTQEELAMWFQTVALIDKPHASLVKKVGTVKLKSVNKVLSGINLHLNNVSKTEAKILNEHKKSLDQIIADMARNQTTSVRSEAVLSAVTAGFKALCECDLESNTGFSVTTVNDYKAEYARLARKLRKNQMNGSVFENNLQRLSPREAVKTFGLNGISLVIGDAVVNPHFHFGHGTSDALRDAENAMKTINMVASEGEDAAVAFYRGRIESRINTVSRFYNYSGN